jgi:hypothetical protein
MRLTTSSAVIRRALRSIDDLPVRNTGAMRISLQRGLLKVKILVVSRDAGMGEKLVRLASH